MLVPQSGSLCRRPMRSRRIALAAVAAPAAVSYAWALYRDPLEPYYAAAVRTMAGRAQALRGYYRVPADTGGA
ncbi:MAG: hypothetical protein QOG20_5903 [Pseudonocardiales bacterium]|jgi:hypothetical protein|nr:hypothetical protein [Pseudonocardiales bacterium]